MRRESLLLPLLIAALYLLVGAVGHDPWRGDDITHFGPIYELIDGGSWWIPSIAGQPLTDFGPLYYWIGAGTAQGLRWLLPLHDGARLASALLAAGGLALLWKAAGVMHGPGGKPAVVLLTLGCLGLVVHVHEIQPAIGLFAAQAAVLCFVASPGTFAPVAAGLSAGAAFLFGGLDGALLTWPLLLFPAADSTPLARRLLRRALPALAIALALSAAWYLPAIDAAGGQLWLDDEIASLTPSMPSLAGIAETAKRFGWFLWPLWPLAVWSLWRASRGAPIRHVPLLLLAGLLALLVVLAMGGSRPVRMLPLVVPLALLAAPAVERLRRGAAAAFDWFAVMTFSTVGLLLWLAWSALVLQWPPGLARHFRKLAPDFELSAGLPALALGVVLVLAWLVYLGWRRPGGRDAPLTWAAGMTMLWCTAATMLQPWFDHTRSYREAGEGLANVLSSQAGECVAGVGLGTSQRAAMHYFGGVRIPPRDPRTKCRLTLVYTDTRMNPRDLARYGASELWRYQRGGGKQRESFVLLRRG